MDYFMIYLLTQLDSIKRFLFVFGTLSAVTMGVILFICGMLSADSYGENARKALQEYLKICRFKLFVTIFCVFHSVAMLLPSTKQAAFIYIAPQIIANGDVKDSIKAIPELAKLGTEYLKTMLKDKIEESNN